MAGVAAESAYLTAGQAARMLGVSPKTLNRWANDGRIACAVTLGGHRRFSVAEIRAVAVSMGLEVARPAEG
jgi:excisionase family DNA binding protein